MSEPGLFCQVNTSAGGPAETAKKHVPVINVPAAIKARTAIYGKYKSW